jgi:hypothetical protein
MQTRSSTKTLVLETQPPTGNVKTNEEQVQVRSESKAPNAATPCKKKGKGHTNKSKSKGNVATPGPSWDIKAHLQTLTQAIATVNNEDSRKGAMAALQAITNALELSRFEQFEHRTARVYTIKLAVPIKQQNIADAMSIVKIGYTHDRIDEQFATAPKNKNGSVDLSEFGRQDACPASIATCSNLTCTKGPRLKMY